MITLLLNNKPNKSIDVVQMLQSWKFTINLVKCVIELTIITDHYREPS